MALTYIDLESVSGAGTPLDTSGTLNIAAGDLLIAAWGCLNDPGAVSIAQDDGETNVFTMLNTAGAGQNFTGIGYVLSATADATATIRLTFGTSRNYTGLAVYQFRPDSGETVTFDAGEVPNSGTGTEVTTGTLSTTGNDEVAVAEVYLYNGKAIGETFYIGGVAADGSIQTRIEFHAWYKIFNAAQTDIIANVTMGVGDTWLADFATFKSAAAAGGGLSIPIVERYYRGMRAA